jgi:hypothetical protein
MGLHEVHEVLDFWKTSQLLDLPHLAKHGEQSSSHQHPEEQDVMRIVSLTFPSLLAQEEELRTLEWWHDTQQWN